MKERRKRNMSRTGLLFLFCLLMLCGCAQITGFMENTEVSGREVESLAAEKEDDTVLLGGMPVGKMCIRDRDISLIHTSF